MTKNTVKDDYLCYVFIHIFYDLINSINKTSWYSRLHTARLLRLLLITDDGWYLEKISLLTNKKVLFKVEPNLNLPDLPVSHYIPNVSGMKTSIKPDFLCREEYLKYCMGVTESRTFNVELIIKRVCNKLGAVHMQNIVEGDLEKDLLAAGSVTISGETFSAHTVRKIAMTTVDALSPIQNTLQEKYPHLRDEIHNEYFRNPTNKTSP